ncbi:Bromodomain containing protein [Trichomonas vaginalis G3]|uniref:Bromodomain containing protein n=1 Tax=Trichomonas vaginalis (strain ATCC PRA-98 / G3) TaxID=412133 RepID=A2FXU6_TRIV3|nr:acetylation-dependent protein binding [Trichomonas vaginalis G3]EAX90281.1 Bromodomain containing protein [Trichomonas vaginalis G3]KAI5508644.1 acetylation-dependent protein binding [Trichomonas vaginalis G3]|eukprot:XP_001303211.1 Bromodomain containing protein [Trichomonas vaginalis G3]
MSLNKFQLTKCLQIIEKLISWQICSPFVELVDPERDGAPDYLEVVKNPMALREVQKKLNDGAYSNLDQFKDDVDLIWSNAKLYNGDDTLFTHMALEAAQWFNEKMKRFPSTPEEEWTRKIQRTTQKLLGVLLHPPVELDPTGSLTAGHGDDEKSTA